MPAIFVERPLTPVVQYPPRKRWTREEYERLDSLGIFDQQRVELIEGELIDKMGKNRPHSSAATLLMTWLVEVFGGRRIGVENAIDVAPEDNPANQPIPDFIVAKPEYSKSSRFFTATPQPGDLDLVVEIADTSLAFDLTVKTALYARAGVKEYWILDVVGRRLLVHRDPKEGRYESVISYDHTETVAPLAAPDSSFPVRDVFPE